MLGAGRATECGDPLKERVEMSVQPAMRAAMSDKPAPRITITYCAQCQWLLRAGWMAQELLSTFGSDLGEVTLRPGSGGIFQITCDGDLIWDRKRDGGFPDAAALKQRVRDKIDPGRDLGHVDRPAGPSAAAKPKRDAPE